MITVSFDSFNDLQSFIDFVTGNQRGNNALATPVSDDIVPTSPFTDRDDIMDVLEAGDIVRWEGTKFQITGKLVEDPFYNDYGNEVVRIKRGDTGKIVKVTFDDNETGKLYLVSKSFETFNDDDDDVPTPADEPVTKRIANHGVYALHVGDAVHWHGAKFDFNGIVEKADPDAAYDDKKVFVRRNDNGKLVSLTGRDLDNHMLVLL